MNIRRLGPGDEATAEQACRLFGLKGRLDPALFLARAEATLLVAEDGDEILGWAYGHGLVHPDGETTMLLYALDVAEPARGRGVGKHLVNTFVAEARAAGCTEVWVLTDEANPAGMATYRSAGGTRDPTAQVLFNWRLADGRHSAR